MRPEFRIEIADAFSDDAFPANPIRGEAAGRFF
jgi:hypothetical protein